MSKSFLSNLSSGIRYLVCTLLLLQLAGCKGEGVNNSNNAPTAEKSEVKRERKVDNPPVKLSSLSEANIQCEKNNFLKKDADWKIQITPRRMLIAIGDASEKLLTYLTDRAKALPQSYHMVMVPVDKTRFFRLGSTSFWRRTQLSRGALVRLSRKLIGRGFPQIYLPELEYTLTTRLFSLQDGSPETRIVGQHFPVENMAASVLEATEVSDVHIKEVKVEFFQEALELGLVDDVMLGHASYEYDEDHFPGINKVLKNLELHPAIKDIPLNEIPASLNPVVVRYLKEVMGHTGLIIPDWYRMPPISQGFLNAAGIKAASFFHEDDNSFDMLAPAVSVKALILAVYAGVDFAPGIFLGTADFPGWDTFRREDPAAFQDFERRLEKMVVNAFERIKPEGSDVILDINNMPLSEKILFVIYFNDVRYERTSIENWPQSLERKFFSTYLHYQKKMLASPNKAVFEILLKHGIGDYNVWSRTGIMTLIQRQKIIENLTGKQFAAPPEKFNRGRESGSTDIEWRDVEEEWFNKLMDNFDFRMYYDAIDWGSAAVQGCFQSVLDDKMLDYRARSGKLKD